VRVVRSVHGVPIRLTDERRAHIVEGHEDLADRMDDVMETVAHPAWVTRGYGGCLIAWKPFGRDRFLSVVFKEVGRSDGFVLTAFFTSKPDRKGKIWP
jgi:hypothetical protein